MGGAGVALRGVQLVTTPDTRAMFIYRNEAEILNLLKRIPDSQGLQDAVRLTAYEYGERMEKMDKKDDDD